MFAEGGVELAMFFIYFFAEEQCGVWWHPAGGRTSPAVAHVFGGEGFALPGADDFVFGGKP